MNVRLGREVLDVVFAELSGYVQFARALAHRLGIVDRSSTTAGVAFIGAHTHHCSLDLRVGVLFDLWLALWFQNQDHELIADAVNIVTKVFNLLVLPVVSVTDEECCYELVQGFIRAVSKDLKLTAALELVGKVRSSVLPLSSTAHSG